MELDRNYQQRPEEIPKFRPEVLEELKRMLRGSKAVMTAGRERYDSKRISSELESDPPTAFAIEFYRCFEAAYDLAHSEQPIDPNDRSLLAKIFP